MSKAYENASGKTLAKRFVGTAFINFAVGAVLGGVMTVNPSVIVQLAPIHAILNPFGWLTMLIYGMTFAVLSLSLGIQMPTQWQGVLQLVVGESGIVLLVLSVMTEARSVAWVGSVLLALAPIIFLVNILTGVRYTKKLKMGETDRVEKETAAARLFGRRALYRQTDRVGQRGTDISLMVFIVAAIWFAILCFDGLPEVGAAPALEWLLYYGWIGGTVLSVALHLAPRFMGRPVAPGRLMSLLQVLYFGGVTVAFALTIANAPSQLINVGKSMMAIGLLGHALVFLLNLRPCMMHVKVPIPNTEAYPKEFIGAGAFAWAISWLVALWFCIRLLTGADAFALASLHSLFLGFITTLVFSVGYTAFPIVLGRPRVPALLSYLQLLISTVGAFSLIEAFTRLSSGKIPAPWFSLGGVLASFGILFFFVLWLRKPAR